MKVYFKYIFYWFITQDARHKHRMGEIKGMHCVKSKDDSTLLYGSATTYEYNPNKPPIREYLTWKEFYKLHTAT